MKKLLNISSVVAIVIGFILIISGSAAAVFTYKNVAREKIITPPDACLAEKPVRGPFTLKSQADIIREHTLKTTKGQAFAEMPRQIAKLDQAGQPVLGEDGQVVLVENAARNMWITATTLITALNLAILAYAFAAVVVLFGFISVWTGVVFRLLAKKY